MLPWVRAKEAFHARFPVSVKKKKKVTRFGASIFGRRWKMRRPVADEAPLRAREKKKKKKNSTQGSLMLSRERKQVS